jgi:hypothetical protein
MTGAARGELRIDVEQVPLDEVENAWQATNAGEGWCSSHWPQTSFKPDPSCSEGLLQEVAACESLSLFPS